MTVVFATNYYNHHQACLARELDRLTDHHFFFLETMPMEQERRALGWKSDSQPDYVIRSYEPNQAKRCRELIRDADAVIWGSCPFSMILPRLLAGKLTFLYSERIFKEGKSGFGFWGRGVKYLLKLGLFRRNHYLLASSAYAAADYNLLGLFRGHSYRWGYFPEVLPYDPDALISAKQPNSLLWVGRMIPYKHPEAAVETARRLKQDGLPFRLKVVGCGTLEDSLRQQIQREQLEDCVELTGSMPASQVRREMEAASLFLYTADRGEGWGAVLNESMNSCCAVVACRAIGAAPYLVEDGENGLLYPEGDGDALYEKAKNLLEHPEEARRLGKNAYETLQGQWNAAHAAECLIRLMESILSGAPISAPESGPGSIAPILSDK